MTTEPLDPQYSAVLAQAIVDTVRDPLLVLDCHFGVTAASRSFLHVFEERPEDVIGRSVYEILHGCFKIPRLVSLLNKVLPEHAAAEDFEIDAVFPRVGRRALIVSAREVFFVGNTHKAILLSFADETNRRKIEKEKESLHNETRRLLREKEVLLLEMQHRIFNSLQIIANILMMKTRITTSEEARRHLEDAYSRVMSVATLQRHIDTAGRSELVEVVPYLTTLCDGLAASVIGEEKKISLKYAFDSAMIPPTEAVSIGLIVTETVINAVKYAFPQNRPDAEILVRYETSGADWRLTVSDNGVGKQKENGVAPPSEGLGSTLVKALTQQIKAQIETTSGPKGLTVAISHTTFSPRLA
ncbi:PAS domain-containing protein [Methylocystis rosea]|uniref:histidine kinase n=2 Tax=Methylocystis rosea TaxID=173366 RepID=A0ABX6EID6_9HYPH|nr:PAS domain-containing protein [Methylocystis rosea]